MLTGDFNSAVDNLTGFTIKLQARPLCTVHETLVRRFYLAGNKSRFKFRGREFVDGQLRLESSRSFRYTGFVCENERFRRGRISALGQNRTSIHSVGASQDYGLLLLMARYSPSNLYGSLCPPDDAVMEELLTKGYYCLSLEGGYLDRALYRARLPEPE